MSTVLLEQPGTRQHTYLPKHLTYCGDCGRLSDEDDATCQRCGGETLERVSHLGEIYSYTTVHRGATSFVLALVQLSGGPIVTARILDVDRDIRIGLPVKFLPKAPDAASGGLFFSPLGADYVMANGG